MEVILDFLRLPVVVTALAVLTGTGVGISGQVGRRSSYIAGVGAVCVMSASTAALAPEATLAPSGAIVGFAVTTMARESWDRRMRAQRSRDET